MWLRYEAAVGGSRIAIQIRERHPRRGNGLDEKLETASIKPTRPTLPSNLTLAWLPHWRDAEPAHPVGLKPHFRGVAREFAVAEHLSQLALYGTGAGIESALVCYTFSFQITVLRRISRVCLS